MAAKKKASRDAFLKALGKVGKDFPEFAGEFALAKVKKPPAAMSEGKKKCIRYGIDPVTGEKICLEWAPA